MVDLVALVRDTRLHMVAAMGWTELTVRIEGPNHVGTGMSGNSRPIAILPGPEYIQCMGLGSLIHTHIVR